MWIYIFWCITRWNIFLCPPVFCTVASYDLAHLEIKDPITWRDDLPVAHANPVVYRVHSRKRISCRLLRRFLPHPRFVWISPEGGIALRYITFNHLDACRQLQHAARATEKQQVIRVFIRALIAMRLRLSNLYLVHVHTQSRSRLPLDTFMYLHRESRVRKFSVCRICHYDEFNISIVPDKFWWILGKSDLYW